MKLCTNYSCKHKRSELPFFLHTTQIIPYKQHMTCNDERKKVLMVKNTKPDRAFLLLIKHQASF